jgi:uncharacterized protein YbjT (DUF2867 family)
VATILIVGATGFIGSEITRALLQDGHALRLTARDLAYGRRVFPQADWVYADLNRLTDPGAWQPLLVGVDIVINASGLLQSAPGDDVRRIQERAIVALGDACAAGRVARIIQISAAGLAGNPSDFMSSKAAADAALLAGPVPAIVLRPGLVIGRNAYGGTQLIRMVAALPVGLHPSFGARIQTVAMEDVVAAVAVAVEAQAAKKIPIDLVSGDALTLADIVRSHRIWLGLRPWRIELAVPSLVMRMASMISDALGWLGWRSPLRSNAVTALAHGVVGDAAATRNWLGREPLTLDQSLAKVPSGKQDRYAATAYGLLPIALAALFLMWFGSGVATLIDVEYAASIMSKSGLGSGPAQSLTLAGAVADLVLAFLLLIRRWTQGALLAMVMLATVYLLLGTMLLPGLWLDPLAPYAKVLPTMALALLLYPLMDRR